MTRADIPAGMRLKEIAGWNQTAADWERFLRASPEGCFVAEIGKEVVGTATTIVYEGRFAWIGMVLVDPEVRGRGIGTMLLEKTLQHLDARRIPTEKLDATPQGRPIYAKLGFLAEYEIERWELTRPPRAAAQGAQAPAAIREILSLDREVFGADRSILLESLHADAPDLTGEIRRGKEIMAYSFGRRGSRADHLGPWMARDEPSASALLDQFLWRTWRETVLVDVLKANPVALQLIRRRGFHCSRPLTRMVRGTNAYPGRPDLLCAILGPEFG